MPPLLAKYKCTQQDFRLILESYVADIIVKHVFSDNEALKKLNAKTFLKHII